MIHYLKKLKVVYSINKTSSYLIVFFFHVINSLFELVNIAILFPIVALLTKNNLKIQNFENFIPDFFFFLSEIEKIIIFFGLFFFIYLLKIIFFIFGHYYQSLSVYRYGANIADFLAKKYLSAPYIFFQKNSSAYVIRNIYKEVNELIESNIRPIFNLLNDILLLLVVLIFLIVIDFEKFLLLILMSLVVLIFFYFIRSIFLRYGNKRQFFDQLRLEHIQNLFNSIKEIKIYNKEEFFFKKFSHSNQNQYKYAGKNLFLSNMPRILIEIIMIIAIIFVLVFFAKTNRNFFLEDIEIKVLFLAAMVRFIPLISRINTSINSLRYGYATFDLIASELSEDWDLYEAKNNFINKKFDFKKSIKFNNVNFFYNTKKGKIFEQFNLEIKKGDIVKIIGASGSGKTTLINLLLGFLDPNDGNIKIDNIDLTNIKNAWRKKIGFVSQQIILFNDTLRENIIFGSKYDKKKFDDIINTVDLNQILKNKINFDYDSLIKENGKNLSGGEAQRVGIARALYNGSEILILDEPTSSLDIKNAKKIENLIYKLKGKKTIIVISHSQSLFSKADQIINLNDKKNI